VLERDVRTASASAATAAAESAATAAAESAAATATTATAAAAGGLRRGEADAQGCQQDD